MSIIFDIYAKKDISLYRDMSAFSLKQSKKSDWSLQK